MSIMEKGLMEYPVYKGYARRVICLILLVCTSLAFSGSSSYTDLTFSESIDGVSEECPQWILDNQVLIDVVYYGFDGQIHRGQLVADARVAGDLQEVFMLMLDIRFPLESVVPISQLDWDDFESMRQNNTSAFNYRNVPFSDRLSRHAYGLAIDINPVQNPYYTGLQVFPEGAVYDTTTSGTLYDGHPVVHIFRTLGWRWGGDWREKDYQHFDKQLEEVILDDVQNHYPWPMER
jgi:hypothetical protein